MSFWDVLSGIILLVIILFVMTGCNELRDADALCVGFDDVDVSMWDDYVTCYNEEINEDGQYITYNRTDVLKSDALQLEDEE